MSTEGLDSGSETEGSEECSAILDVEEGPCACRDLMSGA